MTPAVGRSAPETIEVRIDSIAAGGDGVGRHDGLVVFVPRTAPGDVVRVRAEQRDRFMRGELIEVLEASPLRVSPACEHYSVDRCGGCQVQHLAYESQLDAKAGIIHDALIRIGKLDSTRPAVEASDRPWRYRRKLTLALRLRRGQWIAGLHRYDAPHEVFELRDCPITDSAVIEAWTAVLNQQQHFPRARTLRGAIRLLATGFSFTLEGGREWRSAERLFSDVPDMAELWWQPEHRSRQLRHIRAEIGQAGASFNQVNASVAGRLRDRVLGLAATFHPERAVDAYAGTGELAVALANAGARVVAIEIDRDATRVCAARLPEGSSAIASSVERALPQALPADVVVLNPPRAGIDARVAEILESETPKPRGVIYVSCNPATLARDLRRMPGYRVRSVHGFDMFPQTAHVETVCELVPAA